MRKNLLKSILITCSFVFALSPAVGCNQNRTVGEVESEVVSELETKEVESEIPSEVVSTCVKPKDQYPAFVPGSGTKTNEPEEQTSDVEEKDEEEDASDKNKEETSEETKVETYTVTDLNKTMYVQKQVTVREGPATDYAKLGSLNQNDEVQVTGQASTGWYRFDFNGKVGFCSDKYLGESKVVAEVKPSTGGNNNGGNGGHKDGDKWIDADGNRHKIEDGQEYIDVTGGGVWVAVRDPNLHVVYEETYADMELFNAMNKLRVENGLHPLAWDSENEAKAKERTAAMRKSHLGHSEPTHYEMGNGENVASDFGIYAFNAYYRSEGHRNNMLGEIYTSACAITSRTVLSDGTYGDGVNCIIFFANVD